MLPPLVLMLYLGLLVQADEPLLLFPQSSVFQFTIGMSVPIAASKKGSLVVSSGFQFNYALPWNSSQFEGAIVQARSVRQTPTPQLNLESIYMALEDLLENHGWSSGRACILRTICELAEHPLSRRNQDFIQQIIHLLFSPSEDADCSRRWEEAKWYEEAEQLGRSESPGSCALAYADCTASPLESFTEIAFG